VSFESARDARLIAEAAEHLRVALDPGEAAALARFAELVASWSSRVNLTGARDARALVDVLFADALVLRDDAIVPEGARLVDVGAGAGAPTIPLLLLRPDLRATLVEPIGKRTAFMRTAIGTFDLATRASIAQRRHEIGDSLGELDVALSRATFDPEEWLARAIGIAPRAIVFTGEGALPEHAGAERITEREYALPFGGTPRRIGVYVTR
jgi:16S rRNA (guanine527-N7)-methyltransferase